MSRARALLLLSGVLLCACLASAAQASESVRLSATLTPEHLGEGTTIGFSFQIATAAGRVPAPLSGIGVRYPENLGIATSGLGLATCSIQMLEALGPSDCPSNSVMGIGSALAEIPVGPDIVNELAPVTIFRAPDEKGQFALLFYATGVSPIDIQIALPSLLLGAGAPFGGRVQIGVPLVPSLPHSPDAAIVKLTASIGPRGVVYHERLHGRRISYHPRGLLLPSRCPSGGFPFAAELSFADGTSASAQTSVPCPGRAQRRAHA